MPRAVDRPNVSAIDEDRATVVQAERRQDLVRRCALDGLQSNEDVGVRQIGACRGDVSPFVVRCDRRIGDDITDRHGLRVDRVRDQIIAVLGLRVLAELPRSEHGEAQVGEEPDHSCQYQPTGPQQEFQSSHTSTVSVARTGVNFAPGSARSRIQSSMSGMAASIWSRTSSKSS